MLVTNDLAVAVNQLESGNVLAFPTDTLFGLGVNAYDDDCVKNIYSSKKRAANNPISVCYKDYASAMNDVYTNALAEKIAVNFLPGAITLIMNLRPDSKISRLCTAGLSTIGIRVPDCQVTLNLMKYLDFPITASSANKSHMLPLTTSISVSEEFVGQKHFAILNGQCTFGMESTIIDVTNNIPIILRLGVVSKEELEDVIGEKFIMKIPDKIQPYHLRKRVQINAVNFSKNDAVLGFGSMPYIECAKFMNLSPVGDVNEAARNFFDMLRSLDQSNATQICISSIPNTGIGILINSQLVHRISRSEASI